VKPSAKTPHIAFVTREALMHDSLDESKGGLRQFVRIPRTHAHGQFTVEWVESAGTSLAVMRFSVWKRKPRNRPTTEKT
jgi:hypothetical protein